MLLIQWLVVTVTGFFLRWAFSRRARVEDDTAFMHHVAYTPNAIPSVCCLGVS